MGWGTYRRSKRAGGAGDSSPSLHETILPPGREEERRIYAGGRTGERSNGTGVRQESRGGHERIGVRPNKPDLTAVNPVRQPPCHVTPASGAHLPETWLTSAKREISAPRHEHTSKDVVMCHFPQKL